ncbi:MAG: ABC transporter ATP-binding protein [Polyangiaceae bacterium]
MNQTKTPLVELQGISRIYETDDVETHALSDVALRIDEGEFVSIEGPSGSGKTTLLSILGLLDVPTAGRYQLAGEAVEGFDAAARARLRNQRIGFIFQTFNLIGDLDVIENVSLPLSYRGVGRKERRERARAALARVKMSHREHHFPGQLSGGQQQRVAVARAIAGEPALLLADEPTGSLDTNNGDAVMDLLEEIHAAGATICMVTHNPAYALRANRAVKLLDGRVVAEQAAA